jgi:sensor histidine kinase YesM
MKEDAIESAVRLTANRSSEPGIGAIALRILWIVPTVALLCLIIFLSIGRTRLSESGTEFVAIFVYATLIAPSSAILCSWVGHRYTGLYPRLVVLLYVLVLFCSATAGTLAGSLLLQWMGIVARGRYWHEFWGSWFFSVVITLVIGLSISAFETMRSKLQAVVLEARTRQVEHERAKKLLAEARLSSLESSIHPHFLFNTLNTIAALIPSDPQLAEDTVGKLASLLRFSLNAQHNGLVPLEQELKVVRDYLEIEATRFKERLRYEILVPGSLYSVKVPALSLQTLAENAVKHVAAKRAEGAFIRVSGLMDGDRVRLEVADDGPGFLLGAVVPGHGLSNLVGRLDFLFAGDGRLEVIREQDKTMVRICFPAD